MMHKQWNKGVSIGVHCLMTNCMEPLRKTVKEAKFKGVYHEFGESINRTLRLGGIKGKQVRL